MFHVKHDGLGTAPVSRETQARLDIYGALLLRWNRKINLVSRQSESDYLQRHFEDSLQLARFMSPRLERAVDLGSGAGFPGLVLSIATGVSFDLVEADIRKAAFLREVAALTHANVRVHAVRIEGAAVAPAMVVTARALAPLPALLALAAPFIADGGMALFPKGAQAAQELTDAEAGWHMKVERHPSVTDPCGVILRLTEVRRA